MAGTTKIRFDDIELLENMRTVPGNVDEMKKSLEEVSQLQPFLVQWKHHTCKRPDGKVVNSRYFLLDGYTRYAAMLLSRKEHPKAFDEVEVVLKKCNDAEAQMIMLAANVVRSDFSPSDTANGILRLRKLGYKIRDIADRIGRSVGWCERMIKMNESLAKPVLDAIAAGAVTMNAAVSWLDMPEDKQVAALSAYGVVKEKKGTKAAKRQADRDGGRPEVPTKAETQTVLDYATGKGVDDNYYRGLANGVRFKLGLFPGILTEATKAAKKDDGASP